MVAMDRLRASLAVGCALGLLIGAAPAEAERAKWNQERVTAYAVQLGEGIDAVKSALKASPSAETPVNRVSRYELEESVRLLSHSVSHLVAGLEGGKGYEETAATFRRIGLLRRDAEQHGRRALIPASVLDAIASAGDPLIQLNPYYDENYRGEENGGE